MDDNELIKWRQGIIDCIVKARTEKGMTQTELAEKLGTQRSNISRLERGQHNPSLDFLLRAAAALDLAFDMKPIRTPDFSENGGAYELRLYDEQLLTFTLEDQGIFGLVAKITFVNAEQKKLLPLDLEPTDEGLLHWLRRRVIPKNRTFVEEILKSLGLSAGNTKGIIDVCKGLSLNDSFWIVPLGFPGKFIQYNLYENRFSEILSLVAYTGHGQSEKAFSTSPELTTNGMLPKGWRFVESDAERGEGIYLSKGGTSGAANTGNEPYAEFYACQIAQAMGLTVVAYDLEKWKGILASKCKLFTDIDTAFVPVGRIVRTGGLKAVMDYYAGLGDDFLENLKSMLVFDAVVYNEDRHFGNFGILRDNHSGAIIAPAPLFDHGISTFNLAMKDEIADLDAYAATRSPANTDASFETVCAEVAGKEQARQLRRLIGFEFTRHEKYNWDEERLEAIEKHIQRRVRQLLGLVQ